MKERKGELMDKVSIKRFFAFTLAETLIVMGYYWCSCSVDNSKP